MSLNVRDQASHPYKTTDKITVLYILIFIFLDSKTEDKRFYYSRSSLFLRIFIMLLSSLLSLSTQISNKCCYLRQCNMFIQLQRKLSATITLQYLHLHSFVMLIHISEKQNTLSNTLLYQCNRQVYIKNDVQINRRMA
jgi:hypothetical protein